MHRQLECVTPARAAHLECTRHVKGQTESKRDKSAPETSNLTWVTPVRENKHMTARLKRWPHLKWITAPSGQIRTQTPAAKKYTNEHLIRVVSYICEKHPVAIIRQPSHYQQRNTAGQHQHCAQRVHSLNCMCAVGILLGGKEVWFYCDAWGINRDMFCSFIHKVAAIQNQRCVQCPPNQDVSSGAASQKCEIFLWLKRASVCHSKRKGKVRACQTFDGLS